MTNYAGVQYKAAGQPYPSQGQPMVVVQSQPRRKKSGYKNPKLKPVSRKKFKQTVKRKNAMIRKTKDERNYLSVAGLAVGFLAAKYL